MKLLVVEDDLNIATMIKLVLASQTYAVDLAHDGEAGLGMIEAFDYDVIVLDWFLPKLDGIALCQRVRSLGIKTPILLLTGQTDSHQKAIALNAGADDYVVKPFDVEELIARIQALLRRGSLAHGPILTWGNLSLDPSGRQVRYASMSLTLTPKEYAILESLMRNPKRVMSAQMLLSHGWDSSESLGEETVRAHIKELRHKLKTAGAPKDWIKTIYGAGYQLNPSYETIPSQDPLTSATASPSATIPVSSPSNTPCDIPPTIPPDLPFSPADAQLGELQQLYDHAPCGYHSLDAEGRFVQINQTELVMLGYQREEVVGHHFSEFISPESQQVFQANFPLFKQRGWVRDLEFQMIRKDGSILTVSLSATALKDSTGKFYRSRSVVVDISDRKQSEFQLQRTEARLRYLLSASPAVLYACQAHGDYAATFISENVTAMLGYSSQDFVNNSNFWASQIHPDDRAHVFAELPHLFERGFHLHDYRFRHHNGQYRWVRDGLKLIRDADGHPLEIVGYWIDITDQKQAEQKILEQANLLAIATDAIFVHDLANRTLFWNPGAENLYGWRADEILGHDWRRLLSPNTLPELDSILNRPLAKPGKRSKSGLS